MIQAEFPEGLRDYIGLLGVHLLSVGFCGSQFNSTLHCAMLDKKDL